METEDIYARFTADVSAELQSLVPPDMAGLSGMVAYHLGWVDQDFRPARVKAGKFLRPTLCLLCCEAAGGDIRGALPAAAGLELLHNFSLVHDDIQDRSPERRHRPTVWALWGEAQAINVGDAIFALAHQAFSRLAARGCDAGIVLTALGFLDQATLALCTGQYRDIDFESRSEVTTAEYFTMAAGKTAALLGCATAVGGLLGSGNPDTTAAYRRFGECLGLGFQIQDDILGIWGDAKVTGKPAADDVRSRKKTLPIAWALETLGGAARRRLCELYRLPALSEEQVAEIIRLLEEHGARAHAEALAAEWCERALEELAATGPLPGPYEQLCAITRQLIGRAY